jgi:hypothetical protein
MRRRAFVVHPNLSDQETLSDEAKRHILMLLGKLCWPVLILPVPDGYW